MFQLQMSGKNERRKKKTNKQTKNKTKTKNNQTNKQTNKQKFVSYNQNKIVRINTTDGINLEEVEDFKYLVGALM